ncbi:MAG TPA: SRPBCC family protein [Dongiaceae bacterium]|nr:SRPBCC family protein [Dongiaceae bacterium]
MSTIEKTIEVGRPVSAVYAQWRQCEDFPQFMKGVKKVRPMPEEQWRWKAVIGGRTKRWDAEIVEQVTNQRISWRSTAGAKNAGTITFVALTPAKTRLILYLTYEPKGMLERIGDNLGLVAAGVAADLKRFKALMESRPAPVNRRQTPEAIAPALP